MARPVNHSGHLNLGNTDPLQMGFWVPNRLWATKHYLVPFGNMLREKQKKGTLKPLTLVIIEFRAFIERHSIYRMWMSSMIQETNDFLNTLDQATKDEITGFGDDLFIRDIDTLLIAFNEIITTSPGYNDTEMVGTPMNGLLAVSMATPSGLALFHDAGFNAEFKKVLDAWNVFLKSPESLDKLDIKDPEKPGSWISLAAHKAGVWKEMQHDPKAPGYGFDSWNAFFIRLFKPGKRPFHGTTHDINIGCETTPWSYEDNLGFQSDFWIKDINYSLLDLFAGQEKWANLFVGGQAYQGFLSATHYHRWNSPMDGTIVRSWVQPGTYFAQRPFQGEGIGTWEGTESQPYLGHVAARAIFIFKHQTCGYVALICIGMVEVSTCVIEPKYLVGESDAQVHIAKGEEIGHFEFGGSTHMMIFQEDMVDLADWARAATPNYDPNSTEKPKAMGTVIATPKKHEKSKEDKKDKKDKDKKQPKSKKDKKGKK